MESSPAPSPSSASRPSHGRAVVAERFQKNDACFRRANWALFAAGCATFALLYCAQPLLPTFSRAFQVSPARASLTLSFSTAPLAVAMLLMGSLSEAWGRKSVMSVSLLVAAGLGIACALVPGFSALLALRALQGVALAGLPAVAMAYLSEEVEPAALGLAMGLYVSGNGLGGMAGRILTGLISDRWGWRAGVGIIGVVSLLAAVFFVFSLPASRHFRAQRLHPATLAASLYQHLREPGLRWLFVTGGLLMAGFVTLFNYICYRLEAPPYRLSPALVSWIFLVYLTGVFSSTWMGKLGDRWGRRRILWVGPLLMLIGTVISLAHALWLIVLGVAVATFGFFGGHSVASSWIGRRAPRAPGQAAALYLFVYYTGGSLAGWAGGLLWARHGWTGVATMIAILLALASLIGLHLTRLLPRGAPPPITPSAALPG